MEAIGHVIYAAADGGANTQMTGIYFEGTDSGVSLAALDGHVVAVDSVKAEGAKDMKLIVPKATAKKLISMGVIDDVTLTYTKNSAVFKSDEYTIYTRLIEGKYFAYQKMFTEGEINTRASRTALIGAMTRAKMCTEEKQPAVFQIEDDVLNISIRDKLADYQEQVPLQETVCKSIRLGFDSRLVLETLKAFTCDNIALGFTSPRTPMIVEAEDSDMKAMVLPVAIRRLKYDRDYISKRYQRRNTRGTCKSSPEGTLPAEGTRGTSGRPLSPYERTRAQVAATGNRWAMENFIATHS